MSLHTGYEPARSCTGTKTPGAVALMSWFLGAYRTHGAKNLGIYQCRQIAGSSVLSLHGEGRAADLGVPVGAIWARTLANALVAHSAELGIQLVIHDGKVWSGRHPRDGWRTYTGRNPHRDHLHVELAWWAARTLTTAKVQSQLTGKPPANIPPWPGRRLRYVKGRPVMRGADVRTWQKRMKARGWRIDVDGEYGPKSAAIALAFQREKHLTPDAIVGPKTWAATWTKPITHR